MMICPALTRMFVPTSLTLPMPSIQPPVTMTSSLFFLKCPSSMVCLPIISSPASGRIVIFITTPSLTPGFVSNQTSQATVSYSQPSLSFSPSLSSIFPPAIPLSRLSPTHPPISANIIMVLDLQPSSATMQSARHTVSNLSSSSSSAHIILP